MIVDTHQHNWELSRFPYPWITPGSVLAQDYMPADALPLMHASGVTHCVMVEGGASSQDELLWLLELAAQNAHIVGVVGKIEDMREAESVLARIKPEHRPHLKGVRIYCTANAPWEDFRHGLRVLAAHSLACDVIVGHGLLPRVIELMAANPDVTFILDHLLAVPLTTDGCTDWRETLRPAAALPNVVMKVSEFLNHADPKPATTALLKPYVEAALDLLGAHRLMYGSDWPVCTLEGPFSDTVDLLRPIIAALSPDEQASIWQRTAIQTYRLNVESPQ